jgi:AraC-like DNA-binding protein
MICRTPTLTRAAYFYFDPAVLLLESGTGQADLSFVPRLFFEDAGLWDIAIKLKALVEGPGAINRLYCESLGVVLAHELVRLGSGATHVQSPVRGGLAGWQQRAVASYIEEHFADQISLATLAQLARLRPHHFSRAFKQTFGMRPIDSTRTVASSAPSHCFRIPRHQSPRSEWPWGSGKQAHSRRRSERQQASRRRAFSGASRKFLDARAQRFSSQRNYPGACVLAGARRVSVSCARLPSTLPRRHEGFELRVRPHLVREVSNPRRRGRRDPQARPGRMEL